MKSTIFFAALNIFAFGFNAQADYSLSTSKRAVECYSADNYSYDLNAGRTNIKFTVEGETRGAQKIVDVKTDKMTYVSYTTEEGTLTLSNQGDTWAFTGEEAYPIKCN